jgi:hypothetical protein
VMLAIQKQQEADAARHAQTAETRRAAHAKQHGLVTRDEPLSHHSSDGEGSDKAKRTPPGTPKKDGLIAQR